MHLCWSVQLNPWELLLGAQRWLISFLPLTAVSPLQPKHNFPSGGGFSRLKLLASQLQVIWMISVPEPSSVVSGSINASSRVRLAQLQKKSSRWHIIVGLKLPQIRKRSFSESEDGRWASELQLFGFIRGSRRTLTFYKHEGTINESFTHAHTGGAAATLPGRPSAAVILYMQGQTVTANPSTLFWIWGEFIRFN